MSAAQTVEENTTPTVLNRRPVTGDDPAVFTDIYQESVNIVVLQRKLAADLDQAIAHVVASKPKLRASCTVTPESTFEAVQSSLGNSPATEALSEDIALLVDMFCCLFELKRAGLRLTVLDKAMCPRFHIDRVPCRLVTTYIGDTTQWLPHDCVDRSKLGHGSQGKPDDQSGLYQNSQDIQQLEPGDVALLKGELWYRNEGGGLVHRSPHTLKHSHRLLLTLDFIND